MLIKQINLAKINSVLFEDLIENADIKFFFYASLFFFSWSAQTQSLKIIPIDSIFEIL